MLDAQKTALDQVTANGAKAPWRPVAFYLPQFHPCAENDAFWGKGFTDWRNVVQARPRFKGHHQPHIPADLGFYDLRCAQTRAAQAEMARAAGLHGFCYYHYWFGGKRVLQAPFEAVLNNGEPDFPFMLCWANENWTRAWDGGAQEVLLAQTYSDEDTRAHARHLARAFHDPRYIRIGNRPVFVVYNVDELPDARRWSDLFRGTLQAEGITPYLIRVERYLDRDLRRPAELGFDAALEFQPFSRSFRRWQKIRPELSRTLSARVTRRLRHHWRQQFGGDTYFDMQAFVEFDLIQRAPSYPCFPGACPAWDNSPRRPPSKAIIFRNASPELFARWLAGKMASWVWQGEENLLFINAWNEWGEGNHLEPCLKEGRGCLDGMQQVLEDVTQHT